MKRDVNLFQMVLDVDAELIREGLKPFQRPIRASTEIATRLGISFILNQDKSEFYSEVLKIYDYLYRPSDLYMPALHVGVFMFRDIFFQIRIPVIFGRPNVNPVSFLCDATDRQKQWIFENKASGYIFLDQCIDLMDMVYGLEDGIKGVEHVAAPLEAWRLAKQQLEGAAAILLTSNGKYSVIQGEYIAVELFLKGALLAFGDTKANLKKQYSHDLKKLVDEVSKIFPNVAGDLLLAVCDRMPDFVDRRYNLKDYSREELGNILMDAQFVGGEILRLFTDRDARASFSGDPDWDLSKRHFPAGKAT